MMSSRGNLLSGSIGRVMYSSLKGCCVNATRKLSIMPLDNKIGIAKSLSRVGGMISVATSSGKGITKMARQKSMF